MGKAIGRTSDIGFAKESVRGTAVDATFFVPQMSLTLDEQVTQAIDESSIGVIEDSIDANITEKITVGTLEGILRVEALGLLLLNVFGTDTPTADTPEVGVHTHNFTVAQSAQHQSLTISLKEENSAKRYALAMINSFGIEVALNEYARFTADLRAKIGVDATITPVYTEADEQKLFLPQHGEFKTAVDLAGLGAAGAIEIRSFAMTIAKNLEDDQVIGSLDPSDILNKQISVEGTVELLYGDATFVTDLLADTKRAMRITLENTDITIGAVTNPKLEFDLANVKFSEVTKPFTNNDLIVQTISFKAHYDISDAEMIKATLINETVSY